MPRSVFEKRGYLPRCSVNALRVFPQIIIEYGTSRNAVIFLYHIVSRVALPFEPSNQSPAAILDVVMDHSSPPCVVTAR